MDPKNGEAGTCNHKVWPQTGGLLLVSLSNQSKKEKAQGSFGTRQIGGTSENGPFEQGDSRRPTALRKTCFPFQHSGSEITTMAQTFPIPKRSKKNDRKTPSCQRQTHSGILSMALTQRQGQWHGVLGCGWSRSAHIRDPMAGRSENADGAPGLAVIILVAFLWIANGL